MKKKDLSEIIKNVKQPVFDEEMIDLLISGYYDEFDNMYSFIQAQNGDTTFDRFDEEGQKELFEKKAPGWKQGKTFRHMGCLADIGYCFTRLYINCSLQDIMRLSNLLTDKTIAKGIPLYFKYCTYNVKRSDQLIIYSNLKNIEDYIQILEEIGNEYPEIVQRCGKPPLLTGKINDWIGIGDEPKNSEMSYTEIRTNIIQNVLNDIMCSESNNNDNEIFSKGKVDYNLIKAKLMESFKEEGINIETFAFNEENLEIYNSDSKTRDEYHLERIKKIIECESQKQEIERKQEKYKNEQKIILKLKILEKMGYIPKQIKNMLEATTTRHGFLLDMNPRTVSIELPDKYAIGRDLQIKAYEIFDDKEAELRNLTFDEIEYFRKLFFSEVKDYYINFFYEETIILEQSLKRYEMLNGLSYQNNLDLAVEASDLYSRLKMLADGKSFFEAIGIPPENVHLVCDRVTNFFDIIERKKEELEKPQNELKRKTTDRDYLHAVFQEIGINDINKLREYYEEQENLKVDEEDLQMVLEQFSQEMNLDEEIKKIR